jgi:organic hydroperoxide reductase OsmC/OhrA
MGIVHDYEADVTWTGARGVGTTSYTAYSRDHEIRLDGKPPLLGSADPAFRGDPARYSPEELMVVALAQCHMLWFLHLASADGVTVVAYADRASGQMRVESAGHGQFTEVVLHPRVTLARRDRADGSQITDADLAELHARSREHCFIARSVNFPVRHDPAPPQVAGTSTTPSALEPPMT